METRRERLIRLRGNRSHEDIGAALSEKLRRKIGKGTVWKWEQVDEPNIDLEVFFALADFYDIDPRELAIGVKPAPSALPPKRMALIGAYGRLPPELREPIRAMIETIETMLNPSYQKWSKKEAARVKRRDAVHEVD